MSLKRLKKRCHRQTHPFGKKAVNSEIDSILSNHTWELVDLPPGNKPLGSKWICKRKIKADGTIDKYKARLVVKGFKQKEGLDYFDTYSPVTRITSIRMLIALASVYDLQIHQMDVKAAFLNGELEEEIYMEQPEDFVVPEKENKLAEDLGALPVWVFNSGISHEEQVNTSNISPFVQDTLDGIEFSRGASNSTWGSVRAAMGHPEPFDLRYVAVGNEDCAKKFPQYKGMQTSLYLSQIT
ncbi:hypothetical protein FXO38_34517 [Capsicum annuum]|nr:hypothetical protein FXO38_34517 [Capsicum annuum]KAF3626672.1 hypothetical protein FXO37_30278 [Capsicum annuum]